MNSVGLDNTALRVANGPQPRFHALRQEFGAWMFILPVAGLYLVFTLIPAIGTFVLTFFRWDFIREPIFVGLNNWVALFSGGEASNAVIVTLILTVLTVPPTLAIGLALALALDRLPFLKTFFRSIFFVPLVTSIVAISLVFGDIYRTDGGLINSALAGIGIGGIPWLQDSTFALIAVAIMRIWSHVGLAMLIYLAGLQQIDESLIEAAKIDGASRWDTFWRITLPLLGRSTFFLLITQTISALQEFEAVYVLTNGGPGTATATIEFFIIRASFRYFDVGLASTAAIALFLLMLTITLIQLRYQRSFQHD